MSETSIIQQYKDTELAIKLISLGARIQMLEVETSLSRGRLIKLYKEIHGCPPPKGLLPFSTTWFMTWEANIHSSVFYNAYHFLISHGETPGIHAIIKAYQLYLEQCPPPEKCEPVLGLTRSWILVKFVESIIMQQSCCKECNGKFITHAYHPHNSFTCSLCQPPSRVEKNSKTIKENNKKFMRALSSISIISNQHKLSDLKD